MFQTELKFVFTKLVLFYSLFKRIPELQFASGSYGNWSFHKLRSIESLNFLSFYERSNMFPLATVNYSSFTLLFDEKINKTFIKNYKITELQKVIFSELNIEKIISLYFVSRNSSLVSAAPPPILLINNAEVQTEPKYCNNLQLLNNQLYYCKLSDSCCRINKFENQFYNEQFKCSPPKNTTSLCNNLKKCQNACTSRLPSLYDCTKNTFNPKYKTDLNTCYEKCFENNYKCSSISLVSKINQENYGDIGLGIAAIVLFCLCISRYTCCEKVNFNRKRSFSSSTVHIEDIECKTNNV